MKIIVTIANYTNDSFKALYHGINNYFSVLPRAVMEFPCAMEFEIPKCSRKWAGDAVLRIAAAYNVEVRVLIEEA